MTTPTVSAPAFSVKDAREILATLDELRNYASLSQSQIELQKKCKAFIAYWTTEPLITYLDAAALEYDRKGLN